MLFGKGGGYAIGHASTGWPRIHLEGIPRGQRLKICVKAKRYLIRLSYLKNARFLDPTRFLVLGRPVDRLAPNLPPFSGSMGIGIPRAIVWFAPLGDGSFAPYPGTFMLQVLQEIAIHGSETAYSAMSIGIEGKVPQIGRASCRERV